MGEKRRSKEEEKVDLIDFLENPESISSISSGVQTWALHGQGSWGESFAIWHEAFFIYFLWY